MVGCDPSGRRPTEGWNEDSDSNADRSVSELREKVERKLVEVRNSASIEIASRWKGVPNSECDDLYVDKTVTANGLPSHNAKLRKTTMTLFSFPWRT
jgi:hypothetical protein